MRTIYALCLLIPLAGCANNAINPADLGSAEKSLTLAHLAYQGISDTILAATKSGVLKGTAAAQTKVYYDKAGAALDVADKADTAANAPDIITAVLQANDAITQASNLVKGK